MKVSFRCPPELAATLPRPQPASKQVPSWFREMPRKVEVEGHSEKVATIKKCPAFVDVLTSGFYLPLATDIEVKDCEFSWDWGPFESTIGPYPDSPIGSHCPEQLFGSPIIESATHIVKFNNYWTIELEKGYSLLIVHPICLSGAPFRTISGIVDSDCYNDVFVQIPAVWTNPSFRGILTKGTPIAHCFPVRRTSLEFEYGQITGDYAEMFRECYSQVTEGEGLYKRKYWHKRR